MTMVAAAERPVVRSRGPLAADVALAAAIAWGALAFGAVYPWVYWPLVAAGAAIGAAGMAGGDIGCEGPPRVTALMLALAAFLAAALLQLVPLPLTVLGAVSPNTIPILRQVDLAVGAGTVARHALSIAPYATAMGVVFFLSNALLALGSARLFSKRGPRSFAQMLTALALFLALVGIVQAPLYDGKIYGVWTTSMGGAPFGPFVNKNHFAGWMLMALPVTLGLLCGGIARAMRGVKPAWRDRLLWISSPEASRLILVGVAAVVMALSLVLTMSRSGIAALALAVAVTGVFVARRQRHGGRKAASLVYLVLLAVLVAGWVGVDAIASRFSQAEWSELNARRGAWADAADVASAFPLAGTGLNTYGVATLFYQRHDLTRHYSEAHNDYLQLAAEGGALLVVPAIACGVAFAVAVRRRFREETSTGAYWLRAGAVAGLVAIALQETVEFSLQMPGNAALFAVLCGIALHRAPAGRGK